MVWAGLHPVAPLAEEEGVHRVDVGERPAEDAEYRRVAQVQVGPDPAGLGVRPDDGNGDLVPLVGVAAVPGGGNMKRDPVAT